MPEPQSLAQDWTELAEMDPTVNLMVQHNMPMTAQNYANVYGNGTEEEMPEELPAELQGFSGVGLSELPQGPMPLPEGQMGDSPAGLAQRGGETHKLAQAATPPSVDQPPRPAGNALQPGGPSGQSRPIGQAQFKQSGWKPPTPQKEED